MIFVELHTLQDSVNWHLLFLLDLIFGPLASMEIRIIATFSLVTIFISSGCVGGRLRASEARFAVCGLSAGRGIKKHDDNVTYDGRIVGGRVARRHEVHYLVSVQEEGFNNFHHKCGGTIYSEKWIVTAAHCFRGINSLEAFQITAGEHELGLPEESEQIIPVKRIISHPLYDADDNNDIALLELVKPLKFNQHIRPIKIPSCNYIPKGRARISGWGHLKKLEILDNSHVAYADELQVAEVNVYSLNQCDNILRRGFEARKKEEKFKLHENTFCAGHLNKTIDTCQGDSGGPLACHEKDGDVLCGIVSFGFGCGLKDLPGIYANVAHYHNWIVHVTSR